MVCFGSPAATNLLSTALAAVFSRTFASEWGSTVWVVFSFNRFM